MSNKSRNLVFSQLIPLFTKTNSDPTEQLRNALRGERLKDLLSQRTSGSSKFKHSAEYWEKRYRRGGNSGVGSYKKFARFKAGVLNEFVDFHNVRTVVEFGCGDGNQLSYFKFPNYQGYDVSTSAVHICARRFAYESDKSFAHISSYHNETYDLALSLDVIYHLVEDNVFDAYMRRLFHASSKFVIIYSSNYSEEQEENVKHVRHRRFTDWVLLHQPEFRLVEHIPNIYPYNGDHKSSSFADFFIYRKNREFH